MKRIVAWFRIQALMGRWGMECGRGDYSRRDEVHAELDRLLKIMRGQT